MNTQNDIILESNTAANFMENLWLYQIRHRISSDEMRELTTREIEFYSFKGENLRIQKAKLERIMESLGVDFDTLTSPPDYKALFKDIGIRFVIEYYATMPPQLKPLAIRTLHLFSKQTENGVPELK